MNFDNQLITSGAVQARIGSPQLVDDHPLKGVKRLALFVVLAAGIYRQRSVVVEACLAPNEAGDAVGWADLVAGVPTESLDIDAICKRIARTALAEDAPVFIDVGGQGSQGAKLLEGLGVRVIRIAWGAPCLARENRCRYANQRSQCSGALQIALKQGRASILATANAPLVVNDVANIRWGYDDLARMWVAPREWSRKHHGVQSTDTWDAMSLAFHEQVSATLFGRKAGAQ